MNLQTAKNTLAAYWILYFAYDIAYGEPVSSSILFFFSWLATCYLAARWGAESPNNFFVKTVAAVVSAAAVAIAYAGYAEVTWNIMPGSTALYQVVAAILLQGICASVFAGLCVALPLTAVFGRSLMPAVILVCAPVMAIEIEGIYASEALTTQLLMAFEVVFLPVAVWHVAHWWQEFRVHKDTYAAKSELSFAA